MRGIWYRDSGHLSQPAPEVRMFAHSLIVGRLSCTWYEIDFNGSWLSYIQFGLCPCGFRLSLWRACLLEFSIFLRIPVLNSPTHLPHTLILVPGIRTYSPSGRVGVGSGFVIIEHIISSSLLLGLGSDVLIVFWTVFEFSCAGRINFPGFYQVPGVLCPTAVDTNSSEASF